MRRVNKRIVLGISGATGVIYGVKMLKVLKNIGIETHLVISNSGLKNLYIETEYTKADLESLASKVYDIDDIGSAIASGSYRTDGMMVIPCSIKSLSAIANSFNYNLLIRAADVTLKEKRRLLLLVRETPLHEGHLELMLKATRMGAIVMPPVPAFYHKPKTIEDLIDQTLGKALDLFGIDSSLFKRWGEEDEIRIVKVGKE